MSQMYYDLLKKIEKFDDELRKCLYDLDDAQKYLSKGFNINNTTAFLYDINRGRKIINSTRNNISNIIIPEIKKNI